MDAEARREGCLHRHYLKWVVADRAKVVFLAASVLLFALIGIEIDRLAFEHVLRLDAEGTAIAWWDNLRNSVPEFAGLAAGQVPSRSAQNLLEQSVYARDIYRFRIWDLEQKQIYAYSRFQDAPHAKNITELCGISGMQQVLAGRPCTTLLSGTSSSSPVHFATVFLPLWQNGKVMGIVEIYIDQVRHRESFGKAFLACEAMAGITVFLAGSIPVFLVIRRMRAHRAAQQQAEYLACHDALTGVVNRASIREQGNGALALARRNEGQVALLMLDLDHFKNINDDYGHAAGDELLKQFSQRIRSTLREEDTLARLGGDEFLILQVGAAQPAGAQALADRLLEAFKKPYAISGIEIACASSIGVAMAPSDAQEWERLVSCADAALYRAKGAGRATACYFQKGMEESLRERRHIELDLKKALAQNAFRLVYQPIVCTKDGAISGFEALLRWPQGWPERKPSEFISVAEECGLMPELGAWVLRTACTVAAGWKSAARIAVNLSPVQFRQGDIARVVSEVLKHSGLAPQRLELEITESLWIENTDAVLGQLAELKALGVSIALDDFGTGYSSLKYLWKFPFDQVKIDRSFVEESEHDPKAAAIVETIAALGRTLRLSISAEGVETQEQARRIRALGCDAAQGYLYSAPVTAEEAARMAEKSNAA